MSVDDICGAHWVYRMFDADGRLLYVGMTSNPHARIKVWRSTGRADGHWFPQVESIRWEFFDSKPGAAAAERQAISTEAPLHNINLVPRVQARLADPGRGDERADRMLRAYVNDDMTLEQIGQRHGVTRERVRQVLSKHDPTLYRLAKIRRRARTRLRNWVNAGSVARFGTCRICGDDFEMVDSKSVYCSPVHRQIWMLFRYQVDDRMRATHRAAMAKWFLRNSEDQVQLRYAERVLAGTAEVGRRRRFIQVGSLNWHWALRAYVLDWPLFGMLHEDVQEQIRQHVAGEAVAS